MSALRWLPLAAFLALLAVFWVALFADRVREGSFALVGEPAPVFLLPAIAADEGAGLAHADLIGDHVSIVNVWASWCAPCRVEHPQLVTLAREPGVRLVGINFRDDPADASAFLEELGNPFDLIGADRDGRASFDWGVTGPPETFVVAADGTIIAKHIGAISREDLREVILPAIAAAREWQTQD